MFLFCSSWALSFGGSRIPASVCAMCGRSHQPVYRVIRQRGIIVILSYHLCWMARRRWPQFLGGNYQFCDRTNASHPMGVAATASLAGSRLAYRICVHGSMETELTTSLRKWRIFWNWNKPRRMQSFYVLKHVPSASIIFLFAFELQ